MDEHEDTLTQEQELELLGLSIEGPYEDLFDEDDLDFLAETGPDE